MCRYVRIITDFEKTVVLPKKFLSFVRDNLRKVVLISKNNFSIQKCSEYLRNDIGIILVGNFHWVSSSFYILNKSFKNFINVKEKALSSYFKKIVCRQRVNHIFFLVKKNRLYGINDFALKISDDFFSYGIPKECDFLLPIYVFDRHINNVKKYTEGIKIEGIPKPLLVNEHVYLPNRAVVPAMLENFSKDFLNKKVLDIGTGTGVLAFLAVFYGAKSVTVADLNVQALRIAELNANNLGIQNKIVFTEPGSLFATVKENDFDIIMFNPPQYRDKEPLSFYDQGVYDFRGKLIKRFLQEAHNYLNKGGMVLVRYSRVVTGLDGFPSQVSFKDVLNMYDWSVVKMQKSIVRRKRRFSLMCTYMLTSNK